MVSRTLNRVKLIGNLTADPRYSQTKSGYPVCSFTLATNSSWFPQRAARQTKETEFHWVVAWGRLAEICQKLLQKGSKVFIAGRLQYQERRENGQFSRRAEVVAQRMILL